MIKTFKGLRGTATLYLGDCLEILPTLECVDCIIMDPPYGVGMEYGVFEDIAENVIPSVAAVVGYGRKNCKRMAMTPGIRLMFEYEKPDHVGSLQYPAGCGCNKWGFTCWQPVFYYGKDPFAGTGSRPDSKAFYGSAEKFDHPCVKPVAQFAWLVNRASIGSETVLDPFMGSGTTGIACLRTGRNFIGIEIDPKHHATACERMAREIDGELL